jgi:hypothetical protein
VRLLALQEESLWRVSLLLVERALLGGAEVLLAHAHASLAQSKKTGLRAERTYISTRPEARENEESARAQGKVQGRNSHDGVKEGKGMDEGWNLRGS